VEFVDGKLGAVKIYAQEFNGKTLYVNGPVDVTYEVAGDSVVPNTKVEKPQPHRPGTDKGENIKKDIQDQNPEFNPKD
jgi:hypothetical protein